METPIHTLVTHSGFHFDEALALFLLGIFGEEKFPGVKSAGMRFWTMLRDPERKTPEAYEAEGVLLVGVGGGRFDEHPPEGGERKHGECSATLVAKHLGVANDPRLRKLLEYALRSDTLTGVGPMEIPSLMKAMHEAHPDDPQFVLNWAVAAIGAEYHNQTMFWDAVTEVEAHGRIEELPFSLVGSDSRAKMVIIESDSHRALQATLYARRDCSIVLVKNTRGQVQISTRVNDGIDLSCVAGALHTRERELAGETNRLSRRELRSEGTVPGDDAWYYFELGQAIFNGSLTRPNVAPTQIPLQEIAGLIKLHTRVKPRNGPSHHRNRR